MSHHRSLDFNEVSCTENKEKEWKMNDREGTGRGWKAHQTCDIIVTT